MHYLGNMSYGSRSSIAGEKIRTAWFSNRLQAGAGRSLGHPSRCLRRREEHPQRGSWNHPLPSREKLSRFSSSPKTPPQVEVSSPAALRCYRTYNAKVSACSPFSLYRPYSARGRVSIL
jgi:hypothetical protein